MIDKIARRASYQLLYVYVAFDSEVCVSGMLRRRAIDKWLQLLTTAFATSIFTYCKVGLSSIVPFEEVKLQEPVPT